jgi:hypothetical protein
MDAPVRAIHVIPAQRRTLRQPQRTLRADGRRMCINVLSASSRAYQNTIDDISAFRKEKFRRIWIL